MILELKVLLALVAIALAMPLLQSWAYGQQIGSAAMLGDRADAPPPQGFAGRALRVHRNLLDSLLPFAAVVLLGRALDVSDGVTRAAAVTFLVARLVHAASYLAGVPGVRSVAWLVGLVATAAYGAHLFAVEM